MQSVNVMLVKGAAAVAGQGVMSLQGSLNWRLVKSLLRHYVRFGARIQPQQVVLEHVVLRVREKMLLGFEHDVGVAACKRQVALNLQVFGRRTLQGGCTVRKFS